MDDPDQFIGTNYWTRLTHEPGKPVRHLHVCGICFEQVLCEMECWIEPDLGVNHEGHPYGNHDCCSPACREANDDYVKAALG